MSCRDHCPLNSRVRKPPRHKLDQVRRRLDFSDEVGEAPTPTGGSPPDKYGHFKKLSESHSSHDVEPPMYTSPQLAAVPDSFLEMFLPKAAPKSPTKRVTTVPYHSQESPDIEIPQSFLEYCQERIEINRQAKTKTPSSAATPPVVMDPCYPQESPPTPTSYSSYRGYDLPGVQREMLFDPSITSTPKPRVLKSPTPYKQQGFYPFPAMMYHVNRVPSFDENYLSPHNFPSPIAASTPMGMERYAMPDSRCSSPSPPCARKPESTVSTGDFFDSSPKAQAASGRPRSMEADRSTERHVVARKPSTASVGCGRAKLSDTVCSDDLLKSKSPCGRCPTLGVTPVHSGVSFSSSYGNIEDRQSIRRGIEDELSAREQQERSQLEADLARWQQARRNLVLNTASMGA